MKSFTGIVGISVLVNFLIYSSCVDMFSNTQQNKLVQEGKGGLPCLMGTSESGQCQCADPPMRKDIYRYISLYNPWVITEAVQSVSLTQNDKLSNQVTGSAKISQPVCHPGDTERHPSSQDTWFIYWSLTTGFPWENAFIRSDGQRLRWWMQKSAEGPPPHEPKTKQDASNDQCVTLFLSMLSLLRPC